MDDSKHQPDETKNDDIVVLPSLNDILLAISSRENSNLSVRDNHKSPYLDETMVVGILRKIIDECNSLQKKNKVYMWGKRPVTQILLDQTKGLILDSQHIYLQGDPKLNGYKPPSLHYVVLQIVRSLIAYGEAVDSFVKKHAKIIGDRIITSAKGTNEPFYQHQQQLKEFIVFLSNANDSIKDKTTKNIQSHSFLKKTLKNRMSTLTGGFAIEKIAKMFARDLAPQEAFDLAIRGHGGIYQVLCYLKLYRDDRSTMYNSKRNGKEADEEYRQNTLFWNNFLIASEASQQNRNIFLLCCELGDTKSLGVISDLAIQYYPGDIWYYVDGNGNNALHIALFESKLNTEDRFQLVNYLVDQYKGRKEWYSTQKVLKPPVLEMNQRDNQGATVMHYICGKRRILDDKEVDSADYTKYFELLWNIVSQPKPNIYTCDKLGYTPFHYAFKTKKSTIIDMIVTSCFDEVAGAVRDYLKFAWDKGEKNLLISLQRAIYAKHYDIARRLILHVRKVDILTSTVKNVNIDEPLVENLVGLGDITPITLVFVRLFYDCKCNIQQKSQQIITVTTNKKDENKNDETNAPSPKSKLNGNSTGIDSTVANNEAIVNQSIASINNGFETFRSILEKNQLALVFFDSILEKKMRLVNENTSPSFVTYYQTLETHVEDLYKIHAKKSTSEMTIAGQPQVQANVIIDIAANRIPNQMYMYTIIAYLFDTNNQRFNIFDSHGYLPIHNAAERGNDRFLQYLFQNSVEFARDMITTTQDKKIDTALTVCLRQNPVSLTTLSILCNNQFCRLNSPRVVVFDDIAFQSIPLDLIPWIVSEEQGSIIQKYLFYISVFKKLEISDAKHLAVKLPPQHVKIVIQQRVSTRKKVLDMLKDKQIKFEPCKPAEECIDEILSCIFKSNFDGLEKMLKQDEHVQKIDNLRLSVSEQDESDAVELPLLCFYQHIIDKNNKLKSIDKNQAIAAGIRCSLCNQSFTSSLYECQDCSTNDSKRYSCFECGIARSICDAIILTRNRIGLTYSKYKDSIVKYLHNKGVIHRVKIFVRGFWKKRFCFNFGCCILTANEKLSGRT